jgi:NitT/TauT family transport system substrate-binding protein
MKKISLISLILFTLISFQGCDTKENKNVNDTTNKIEKISVRLPIPVVEAGQTPFYIAYDKGYYKDEGLEVDFGMGSKELNPVKMVIAGKDTFGVLGGPDTLLTARSKGHNIKAISILHKNSNFPCLITLKSSGITKLEQLQNKKIGFFYGHISTDVLRNMLRKNSIEYTEVDVGFDYSQLIAKKIDAEWAFTVTAGLQLPYKGIDINIISPKDYNITTDGYTIFAKDETIKSNPEMVSKFVKATLKGVDYMVKHPNEALESLLKRNQKLNKELSLKRLKKYIEVTSNGNNYPLGYMDENMFKEAYTRLVEEKVIKQEFDIQKAFTIQFIEK